MANNKQFHKKDIEITIEFLEFLKPQVKGGNVLDICGGMSRCGQLLSNMYDKIDIFDIKPNFGSLDETKRGQLIKGNLKDFKNYVQYEHYDCCFGKWALSYVGYEHLNKVIVDIYMSIKSNGILILQEPILELDKKVPKLCPSG